MNLDEAKTVLSGYSRKLSFWRRSVYLELIIIILFAILAFLIRLGTGNYLVPAILAGCMIPTTFFLCFSLYKIRFWEDKVDRQSIDVSLLDFQR